MKYRIGSQAFGVRAAGSRVMHIEAGQKMSMTRIVSAYYTCHFKPGPRAPRAGPGAQARGIPGPRYGAPRGPGTETGARAQGPSPGAGPTDPSLGGPGIETGPNKEIH